MWASNFLWRISPLFILLIGYAVGVNAFFRVVDAEVLRSLPYIVSFILLGFSCVFNRSRFVVPVLATLMVYWFIQHRLQTPLTESVTMGLFIALNLIFCCQLILVALMPEKGVFNRWGLMAILVAVLPLLSLATVEESDWLVSHMVALMSPDQPLSDHYWLSNKLLAVHACVGCVLMVFAVCKRSATEYALLLTWMVTVVVFYDFAEPLISAVGYSLLMVSLFIILLQSHYHIAFIDPLTGIPGRRALESHLQTLGKHYVIAMLDVDYFKKFNDTWGHDVGDQVLRMVASKINRVAGGGKAFRFGGEEFTVVFNRAGAELCYPYLEEIRNNIDQHKMHLRRSGRHKQSKQGKKLRGKVAATREVLSVSISIGIGAGTPGTKPAEVIKTADENLYCAKRKGRNRTWPDLSLPADGKAHG